METKINSKFVERYQILYEKDKDSKVFAPLAEAYRKLGLLEEAKRICERGVKNHPDFPSGRMAMARIYLDLGDINAAAEQLKKVTELSPENILAHRLYAQTLLKMHSPKEALHSFKMILYLNPSDRAAFSQIQKLESLTADEYGDDVFEMRPIYDSPEELSPEPIEPVSEDLKPKGTAKRQRVLERVLSLADAFIVRNDIDKALQTLEDAENQLGPNPEFDKRFQFLKSRGDFEVTEAGIDLEVTAPAALDPRIRKLESMLERIAVNSRKSD